MPRRTLRTVKRPSYILRGAEDFKAALKKKGEALPPGHVFAVRKEVAGGVEEGEGGRLDFTLSTSAVDRSGDVVSQQGWHLENFRKNPVVLWAHDQRALPIAKAPNVVVEDGKLKARGVEFAEYDFAQLVRDLYGKGFMSAVSVGFLPRKWVWNEERGGLAMDFQEQELLEFSAVPVPANPEALIGAKSAGLNMAPLIEWAEKVLDGEGTKLVLPREQVEAVRKALVPARTHSIPAPEAKGEDDGDEYAEDALMLSIEALGVSVDLLRKAVEANTAEVKALRSEQSQVKAAPAPTVVVREPSAEDIAARVAAQVKKQLAAGLGRVD